MEKLITRWTRFFRNSRSVIVAKRGGHIVKKCPEKEQKRESEKKKWKPKSKFGKKKKNKRQKICFVEEDLAVRQSLSGSDWPMFTVWASRGKEFIVQ